MSEFRVNTTTANSQAQGTITALADGGFLVIWASDGQDGSSYGVYAQRYDRYGAAVGTELRVNAGYTSHEQSNPAVTTLADGGYLVTWHSYDQDGSGWGIYAQRYDGAGGRLDDADAFRVNATTAGDQWDGAVAALADGGFVVTWTSTGQDGSGDGVYAQRYTVAGATVGPEFQVNTTTAGRQWQSAVTALTGGGFVVTWTSEGQDGNAEGVYGQRYNAAGVPVGSEFRVNTTTTDAQWQPAVTALADGGFAVAWTSHGQLQMYNWDMYVQRYTSAGAKLGSEVRVNSTLAGYGGHPAIRALADGGFLVTWDSWFQDGSLQGVYAQRFDEAGAKAGVEFRVNTTTQGSQEGSAIAALADGGFAVSWQSEDQDGSGWGVYARRYDAAGAAVATPQFPEFQVNTYTSSWQGDPDVATLAEGGHVVVWHSDGQDGDHFGIYAQRYDSDGGAIGAELRVNTATAGSQVRPSVAALTGGGWVVSWYFFNLDTDTSGVYAQRYDQAGATAGAELQVNTAPVLEGAPTVAALSGGGFVIAWTAPDDEDGRDYGIYARRYDAAGAPLAAEFRVNAYTTNWQQAPAVAALAGGGFLVTWESTLQDGDGRGIYGRRFDNAGAALGSEFRVNTTTASSQEEPAVAALTGGGSVVAWQSYQQDGSYEGIYARRYNSAGKPVAAEFRVNTTTAGYQIKPTVAALADGGFVVSWESYGQDGDSTGVFAQRYDGASTPVGMEFQVNIGTANSQGAPTATALPDGGFLVAWESYWQDGSYTGVYARRFPADLCPGRTLAGTSAPETLPGTRGNDYLYGHGSADSLGGAGGNDLLLGGGGADTMRGGTGDDSLIGSGGADSLIGGDGADSLVGGPGNDTYVVDAADILVEVAGGGVDLVKAGMSFSLAVTGRSEVENLTLTGTSAVNGTGNAKANVLTGNGAANVLYGHLGNDRLVGAAGNDILIAGAGADTLAGGLGNDRFKFVRPTDAQDTLTDFTSSASEKDKLVFVSPNFGNLAVGTLAAAHFRTNATGRAGDADDRFIFETDACILWYDADGKASASAPVAMATLNVSSLANTDILIVAS